MKRLALAFLATLWLAAPAWALQDTCTFDATSYWGPIGTHPGGATCTGGDNNSTIDAGDIVVIPAGVTVTVIADVTQDGTAGAGITVQTDGTLNVSGSNMGTPAALNLTLGDAGLDSQAGSTLILHGGFRSFVTGAYQTAVDEDSEWYVGNVIPCAGLIDDDGVGVGTTLYWEPDCDEDDGGSTEANEVTGEDAQVMFAYPNKVYDPDETNANSTIDTAIAAMVTTSAKEDVIYFVEGGAGSQVPAELWYPYEVVDTATADARLNQYFQINVHQGDRNPIAGAGACVDTNSIGLDMDGYTLPLREVERHKLQAAISKGDTTFSLLDAAGVEQVIRTCTGDASKHEQVGGDFVGRWARFMSTYGDNECADDAGDGPCIPAETPIRLLRFEESGGANDTFTVGDTRGIPSAHASGSDVLMRSYGFQRGDPFIVWIPVRVLSATADAADTPIVLNGATTVVSTIFDGIGSSATAAVAVTTGFSTVDWDYVWFKDGSAFRNFFYVGATLATQHFTFKHTVNIPGDIGRTAGTGERDDHFFIYDDAQTAGASALFEGFAARYYEDDQFGSSNVNSEFALHIDGGRFQFPSGGGASYGAFETQNALSAPLTAKDIECIDCADSHILNGSDGVDGLMAWGARCPPTAQKVGITQQNRDFTILGGETWNPACSTWTLLGVTNFVVRDHWVVDSIGNFAGWIIQGCNGLILNSATNQQGGFFYRETNSVQSFENGLLVNLFTTDLPAVGCNGFNWCFIWRTDFAAGGGLNHHWKNVSAVFTDDYSPPTFNFVRADPGPITGLKYNSFGNGDLDDDSNVMKFEDTLFMGLRGPTCGAGSGCTVFNFNSNTTGPDAATTGIVWEGDQCFFNNINGAIEAEVANGFGSGVLTEILSDADNVAMSLPPGFLWEERREMSINANSKFGSTLNCGHKASIPPGVRRYRMYHALSKILPENAATLGVLGGGGGGRAPRTY